MVGNVEVGNDVTPSLCDKKASKSLPTTKSVELIPILCNCSDCMQVGKKFRGKLLGYRGLLPFESLRF